ncbi:F-box only protein 7-like [Haliotis rufescens]|uniref:F-box only protein 7-like n=1 Tax=Haliotis rufescens TaxID=6454 RepID=UPI00201EF97F|nr:F-box only protein 7-like [Haliotis rufescens]
MKLRVRIQGVTKTVSLGDGGAKDVTFAVLKQKITSELGLCHVSFALSLNKKDILEGDETVLDDFGIVSGDLIHVLVEEGASTSQPREVTPTNQPREVTPTSQPGEVTPATSHTSTLFTSASNVDSRSDRSEDLDASSADDPMEGSSNMGGSSDMLPMENDPVVNRCLSEPLQCCESTTDEVPVLLAHLYESVQCEDQNDFLWVVIHTLMLEAGFKPTQGDDSGSSMPDNWRQPALYNTRYRLPESDGVVSAVTGVVMGSFLIVHGYIVGNEIDDSCSYKVILRPSEYFTGDTQHGPAKCYKNLKLISRSVKNHVCLPLLKDMRTVLGYPDGINLLSLTHELKLKILGFLDSASLLKMDRTCQHFHSLARDRAVWRRRYLRDFGSRGNNSLSLNWYELYKAQYRSRKEARKAMREMTIITPGQVWMQQRPHHPFAPMAPYNGGIVGGDYDLNPPFQGVPDPLGRRGRNPLQPLLPQPRFDPFGPLSDHNIFPGPRGGRRGGRGGGGGLGRGRGWMGGFGGGPGMF